jgi:hypothetical protein
VCSRRSSNCGGRPLFGIALVLKSLFTTDANELLHLFIGLTIMMSGAGLMLGLGGKPSE